MKSLFGAIEAGGSKFNCLVASAAGSALAERRIATTVPQETLPKVMDFFEQQADMLNGCYASFGIASFGPLDLRPDSPSHGHIIETPKPAWSHTDLVGPLLQRFGCPVAIDTDVNAAALAEAREGAGRGCDTVVYVTVGTGIGGGIYLRDRTHQGTLHPEMGHILVRRHPSDISFEGCCPFHGDCLEGLASGTAIAARYGARFEELPAEHDAPAIVAHYLGQLALNIILMLAPDRIVLGGGVMKHPALLPLVRDVTRSLLQGYAGLDHNLDRVIVAPGLGDNSGLSGACLLARSAGSIHTS